MKPGVLDRVQTKTKIKNLPFGNIVNANHRTRMIVYVSLDRFSSIIVQIRITNPALAANRIPEYHLVKVVEFVPFLFTILSRHIQRLKAWSPRQRYVDRLCYNESPRVEQVEVVIISLQRNDLTR